ncbi:uncharacterized protein LOC127806909 isoform X3 [Diospyros lotus]|uniref:uncharacterized protein LOC127806909 isoform X3 n=1 Tax=Diospyros lotus TaxID=55363 RepID=UPI002251B5F8|nr:uncharacterized protein LOC127806909 isoform X3 [Diospyros lotus]
MAAAMAVQFLQERNVNVVIRDERDLNAIRIREAKAKEKEKAISSGKGKKKVHHVAHNDNVLSKAALAQRARREREKIQKSCSAYQLGQRLRREREKSNECINPRQSSLTPIRRDRTRLEWETITEDSYSAEKRIMVTHHSTHSFSIPITSLAPQRNRIGWKNIWSLKGEIQLSCFDGDVIRLLCMFLIGDTYKLIRRFFGK